MTIRNYEGIIIKKELTQLKNYRLTIKLNNGKIIFCHTRRFIQTNELVEKEEYFFSDSQKNGGKWYFLDEAKRKAIVSSNEKWKNEVKEYQVNILVKKYKIKDLDNIEKRLIILKDKNSLEYWALLIVKHKRFLSEKINYNEREKEEIKLLNFISQNWNIYAMFD